MKTYIITCLLVFLLTFVACSSPTRPDYKNGALETASLHPQEKSMQTPVPWHSNQPVSSKRELPDSCGIFISHSQVHDYTVMTVEFRNNSSKRIGYQIRPTEGCSLYFQQRYIPAHSTSIMNQGALDGHNNNSPMIHTDPPVNQWLDFNFVIYNDEWPHDYHVVGTWYYNPDFWPVLYEQYYSSMCVTYEWQIKILPNGSYRLRVRT